MIYSSSYQFRASYKIMMMSYRRKQNVNGSEWELLDNKRVNEVERLVDVLKNAD